VLPNGLLGLATRSLRLRCEKPSIGQKLRVKRPRKLIFPGGSSCGYNFKFVPKFALQPWLKGIQMGVQRHSVYYLYFLC
jgi:hypothetical protein